MGCEGISPEPQLAQPSLGKFTQALQGETCITLQRSTASTVADAKISNRQPDKNFSREPVASVSSLNSHVEHLLLRFDTSGIPSSATIASASLTLWQVNSGQAASLRVHAVTQPWAEGSVTWSSFGSAFTTGAVASLEASGPSNPASRTVDVTSLVSTWVHQPSGNYGLLIAQPTGKTLVDTSESPTRIDSPGCRSATPRSPRAPSRWAPACCCKWSRRTGAPSRVPPSPRRERSSPSTARATCSWRTSRPGASSPAWTRSALPRPRQWWS